MKAPDKIYVCIPQRLNLSTFKEDSKYVGMAYNDKGNLRSPQIEEYIRKGALLEWLENKIKISDGGFVNGLVCLAYKDIIEHLNEM